MMFWIKKKEIANYLKTVENLIENNENPVKIEKCF